MESTSHCIKSGKKQDREIATLVKGCSLASIFEADEFSCIGVMPPLESDRPCLIPFTNTSQSLGGLGSISISFHCCWEELHIRVAVDVVTKSKIAPSSTENFVVDFILDWHRRHFC